MPNVPSRVSHADRRINIDQRYDRAYWSFVFGVSQQQLREAVRNVGAMAKDVERELSGGGRPAWKASQQRPQGPSATRAA